MSITRRAVMLAAAASTVGGGEAKAAERVRIGQIAPLTGAGAASGPSHVNGAKLALEAVNAAGGMLGGVAELVVEDDLSTGPGALAAIGRLVARGDVVGIIGSTRSVVMHAIASDILKAGKPVMFGGTDPALTALGNPWLFRCQPNDSYSARAMAEFGVTTLGKRSWAIVHSSDPFGGSGSKALQAALERLGAKTATDLDYKNQQGDFASIVQGVKASDADILASYVSFEPDQIAIARQMHAAGVSLPWLGSQFIAATAVLQQAGETVYGTYAVAAFNADASAQARAFAKRYEKAYSTRADFFAAWPFDAVTILARAINAAGSTEPAAVRGAILAIRGYDGAEGTFDFDANGDGLHGYNIVHNDNGQIVFVRRFDFTD
jgi:branched-chain amino acid transport system substrate-binding protein